MRFVSPETVRIHLKPDADGTKNWIDVKQELTVGEDKRYRTAGFSRVSQGEGSPEISVNFSQMAIARVEAYLVDWSAKKPDGKDLPVSRTAIEQLSADSFDEIDQAIQEHMTTVADEKKAPKASVA